MKQSLLLTVLSSLAISGAAQAQEEPSFTFPLDCSFGKTCTIVNYVDVNPALDEYEDFACGKKTYDGHKGVDFALRSRLEMNEGINVFAALDGTVLRLRDGLSDQPKTETEYQALHKANKDCGNGILLQHENGLQTFYCHLKKGSVRVRKGAQVKAGQTIAKVGQSGFSEFPHLHFAVIKDGAHYIDPFTSASMDDGCGKVGKNMWEDKLGYEPYAVFDGGFRDSEPDFEAIKTGAPIVQQLPRNSKAIVYWIGFYHAKKGDQVMLTITDPDGFIFHEQSSTLKKNRKRPSFLYAGRKMKDRPLKTGTYIGKATFSREGMPSKTFTHRIEIK